MISIPNCKLIKLSQFLITKKVMEVHIIYNRDMQVHITQNIYHFLVFLQLTQKNLPLGILLICKQKVWYHFSHLSHNIQSIGVTADFKIVQLPSRSQGSA